MEEIIDTLELVHVRVKSGETLSASLKEVAPSKSPRKDIALSWCRLRESILSGRIPAETGLSHYIQNLKILNRIEAKVKKSSTLPLLQAWTMGALSLIYLFVGIFFFPASLRPSLGGISLSLFLLLCGTLHINWLLKQFQKRMWFSSWIQFLCFLESSLGAGISLAQSLKENLSPENLASWPPLLSKQIKQFSTELMTYDESAPQPSPVEKIKSQEETLALVHLKKIRQLYFEGRPLKELLRNFIVSASERFEQKMDKSAESFGLKLLIPLFLFYVPAILTILFGPLIGIIA